MQKKMFSSEQRVVVLAVVAMCVTALATSSSGEQESERSGRTYVIVDTGQRRFYGHGTELDCPKPGQEFHGQDAHYAVNTPRYKDNGDGTISDLNTGLVWQKTPDYVRRDQQDAERYARDLVLAGKSDWRLPTIKELFSIADFRGNQHTRTPYIDTKVFDFKWPRGGSDRPGQRGMDAQYASSTRYVGITMGRDRSAFGFNFADGRIKSYPLRAQRYVRCVRGNRHYGKNRYRDNRDGTITDHATGLIWQKADSRKGLDWKQALAYAERLTLAGKSDWRLPSIKELQSIVDYTRAPDALDRSRRGPAIHTVFEVTVVESWYWSSTTHLENDFAYYVSFGQSHSTRRRGGRKINAHGAGAVRSDPKLGPNRWPDGLGPQADEIRIYNYVRCVRGGPVTRRTSGPAPRASSSRRGGGGQGRSGSRFVRRLDRDGDGKVSRSEWDGPAHHFDRLDRNGDGFLDADEAPSGPPGRRRERRRERQRSGGVSSFGVITVGTGSPLYNPERGGPCAMVRHGNQYVIVDMGEGTSDRLNKGKIRLKQIAAFCFTHHHRDHNADAMSLLPQAWPRGSGQLVIGPKGTRKLVDFLRGFYKEDLDYRLGNRGSSFAELPAPTVHELPLQRPLEVAGMKLTVAQVNHTITTFAYRFDAGGKSIVISGDLTYSKSLVELARGADILVIDSGGIVYKGERTARRGQGGRRGGGQRGGWGGKKKQRAHASLEEVARMAASAGVKQLILTHFRPGEVDVEQTSGRIGKIYRGKLIFAEDMKYYQ